MSIIISFCVNFEEHLPKLHLNYNQARGKLTRDKLSRDESSRGILSRCKLSRGTLSRGESSPTRYLTRDNVVESNEDILMRHVSSRDVSHVN